EASRVHALDSASGVMSPYGQLISVWHSSNDSLMASAARLISERLAPPVACAARARFASSRIPAIVRGIFRFVSAVRTDAGTVWLPPPCVQIWPLAFMATAPSVVS